MSAENVTVSILHKKVSECKWLKYSGAAKAHKRVAVLDPGQKRPGSIPCLLTNCSQRLLLHFHLGFCLPDEASSEMDFFVMCDMKPTIEKITNPANMLVVEFIQQTIMESLEERKNEKKPPAHPCQEQRMV